MEDWKMQDWKMLEKNAVLHFQPCELVRLIPVLHL